MTVIGSSKLNLSGIKVSETPSQESEIVEEIEVQPDQIQQRSDFRQQPVTEEAFNWLSQKNVGTHAFKNFFPKFMQVMVATVLGRQITLDEIRFFVGLDGPENSAVCAAKAKQHQDAVAKRIKDIRDRLDYDVRLLSELPDYSEELKREEVQRLTDDANAAIIECELGGGARFTPVWWVDPRINRRLLEEMDQNGGDVARAFLAGDRLNDIVRSGCYYEGENSLVAFSGSPWYFNPQMRMMRIATSPLGRVSVRHPEARNSEANVKVYFGTGSAARQTQLRQHWGISNREIARRERRASRAGHHEEQSRHMGDRLVLTDNAINEALGIVSVREASARTGKGVKRRS